MIDERDLPADLNELAKERLQEVARGRGIEGYSTMSKGELVKALRKSLEERPPTI